MTKWRKKQLALKIKELGKKSVQIQEENISPSWWQTIKMPLFFYTLGIILVVIAGGWLLSKFREK